MKVIGERSSKINRLMINKVWKAMSHSSNLPANMIRETSNNLLHWNSSAIYASRIDKQTKRNNISIELHARDRFTSDDIRRENNIRAPSLVSKK